MKFQFKRFCFFLSLVILTGSCKKKEDPAPVKQDLPTITTTDVTDVNDTSAVSGGNITDEGTSVITAVGICWDEQSGPTLLRNKTVDGTGTGSYGSKALNLKSNTTYYLRAYATNLSGTAYGNEISFTTAKSSKWVLWSNGLNTQAYSSVPPCFGKIGSDVYLGIGQAGVYKSTGGQNNWVSVNSGRNELTSLTCMAVKGSDIYAGLGGNDLGLFYSNNGGGSWSSVNIGNAGSVIKSLDIQGNNILIYSQSNSATEIEGLFLSTNNGSSWTNITPPTSYSPYFIKLTDAAIYYGSSGAKIYKSTNNGTSWSLTTDLPTTDQIVGASAAGSDLYVSTSTAIYKTQDGTTWTKINSPNSSTLMRAEVTFDSGKLYTSCGNAVYSTTDNGANWIKVGYSFPSVVPFGSVRVYDGKAYAVELYNPVIFKLDL